MKILPSQQGIINHILSCYNNKLHHSLMFIGNGEFSFSDVLTRIIAFLILDIPIDDNLDILNQKLLSNPSVFIISTGDEFIKVDYIREINKFISLSTVNNTKKVVIIDNAHLMNVYSSNALLKMLEEPNSNTYFLINTSAIHKLAKTIISRSQFYCLPDLSQEDLKILFGQKYQDNLNLINSFFNYNLAFAVISKEHYIEIAYTILNFLDIPSLIHIQKIESYLEVDSKNIDIIEKIMLDMIVKIAKKYVESNENLKAFKYQKLYTEFKKCFDLSLMYKLNRKNNLLQLCMSIIS